MGYSCCEPGENCGAGKQIQKTKQETEVIRIWSEYKTKSIKNLYKKKNATNHLSNTPCETMSRERERQNETKVMSSKEAKYHVFKKTSYIAFD